MSLLERYDRKCWSVRLRGVESGQVSPALSFLRFRSRERAQEWVDAAEERDRRRLGRAGDLTQWETVDMRTER